MKRHISGFLYISRDIFREMWQAEKSFVYGTHTVVIAMKWEECCRMLITIGITKLNLLALKKLLTTTVMLTWNFCLSLVKMPSWSEGEIHANLLYSINLLLLSWATFFLSFLHHHHHPRQWNKITLERKNPHFCALHTISLI